MWSGAYTVMTKTMRSVIIADAGPVIHLDELGCLDVLTCYPEVLLPEAVWQEVMQHRPQALQHSLVNFKQQQSKVISLQVEALVPLYTLHKGEREALMLCVQFSDCMLLTDDTAARLAAKSLNIKARGTLGLLLQSIRHGLRTYDEVLAALAAIPSQSTLHVRPALLAEVIEQVRAEAKKAT